MQVQTRTRTPTYPVLVGKISSLTESSKAFLSGVKTLRPTAPCAWLTITDLFWRLATFGLAKDTPGSKKLYKLLLLL